MGRSGIEFIHFQHAGDRRRRSVAEEPPTMSGAPPLDPAPVVQTVGRQVRVPKMAELVAAHLRRQIVRGELAQDEALPSETALMEQFQVSRPTLREAFRVLESESLITVRRGAHGGARVQLPNAGVAARYAGLILEYRGTTVEDVYEARVLVESPAVGMLARSRTPEDVETLRAALTAHSEPGPHGLEGLDAHSRFHALLVELTRNQTLRVLMNMVEHIIMRADWSRVTADVGSPDLKRASRKGFNAHHRVVELIAARDDAGAERLWRRHLTEAKDYLAGGDVPTVLDLLG
jgi:GntR family transcriptional repressor for pyruvate dehydrogenase complex